MCPALSLATKDVDRIAAGDQGHHGALGCLALAVAGAGALALAGPVGRVHRIDLDLEDLLDRAYAALADPTRRRLLETLRTGDARITPSTFAGKRVVLNIFPNIETGVCQQSVRTFNERANDLDNTVVLNVSNDELETLAGFCAAEGLDNVTVGSAKGTDFGKDYGLTLNEGPLADRLARAVVVVDTDGSVLHSELVPEIAQEPDYDAALAALN